jgi:hypothetical protein
MRRLAVFAFALLCVALPAAAQQPDWKVARDGYVCVLRQPIGAGEAELTLYSSELIGGDWLWVSFREKPGAIAGDGGEQQITARLDPGGEQAMGRYPAGAASTDPHLPYEVQLTDLPASFSRALQSAPSLSLLRGGTPAGRFALHLPGEAFAALRACRDAQMREYGVDPAPINALQAEPSLRPEAENWAFGADGIGPGQGIGFVMLASIDASGVPTACKLLSVSSTDDGLAARLCGLFLAHARYVPALGADGKPVATQWLRSTTLARARNSGY